MSTPVAEQSAPSEPRRVAAEIIRRWLETGDFPDRVVDGVNRDRGFVTEVVFGTVKWRRTLDFLLRQVVERPPDKGLRAYLLTGLYQLWFMNGADYAVVNETVSAVRSTFSARQAGFANAVLRRVLRERPALQAALAKQAIGIRFSHPDALIERWTARYGETATLALCEWDNQPPPLVLRIDPAKCTVPDFIGALAAAGHEASPHPFAPDRCAVLVRGADVRALPGYGEGCFVVQDPSTLAAVDLLDPQPGESILDACAAPGGKTVAIAQRMQSLGVLVAADLHADRLPPLRQNLERLRLPWVTVCEADVGTLPAEAAGPYDAVLLDVPCSNTGVLRRRPDARWRFSAGRLAKLVETQRALLTAAAALLKPGGRLVYSTCSLEPEEGEGLVRDWVAAHSAFVLAGERRLLPSADDVDGAYAARLNCGVSQ